LCQFTNAWSELLICWVTFHLSHLYNRTDLTFVWNNQILILEIWLAVHRSIILLLIPTWYTIFFLQIT
jgi:hypothetical protein